LKKLWPIAKFPVLEDEGIAIFEATTIIEHLAIHHAGPVRLIPADPKLALEVRMMDRIFDNYVMTPMNWIVQDARRPPEARDAQSVVQGRALLDTTYHWLNQRMAGRVWAPARHSAWPTARPPHHYSMQIGRIRSRTSFPICGRTETACWLARHLRVPWTRRDPIVSIFPLVLLTETRQRSVGLSQRAPTGTRRPDRASVRSLGSGEDRLYPFATARGKAPMLKSVAVFALATLTAAPAFADGMKYTPRRHYPTVFYLPAERHVIEVVSPPYSGNFIINGARFTARTPACFGWVAGERITLVAGDWNARCAVAVFYNFYRRNTCEMWCGGGW
jgi:hypothetical protein